MNRPVNFNDPSGHDGGCNPNNGDYQCKRNKNNGGGVRTATTHDAVNKYEDF